MKLTSKEIQGLQAIIEDYRMCSKLHYCVDILDHEMCFIVEMLARNKAATWLRQFTANQIEVATMCEIILENKKK